MNYTLLLDVDLPGDLARFKVPASVAERLSALLDNARHHCWTHCPGAQ